MERKALLPQTKSQNAHYGGNESRRLVLGLAYSQGRMHGPRRGADFNTPTEKRVGLYQEVGGKEATATRW